MIRPPPARVLFAIALTVIATVIATVGATACRSDLLSCADAVRNGSESDVDCGGAACNACDNGRDCYLSRDCRSGLCASDHVCRDPSPCRDGVRDTGESDVDCGGACAPCPDGKMCNVPADCQIAACTKGRCGLLVTCTDGVRNGSESDIDCGGTECPRCPTGSGCQGGLDCVTGLCISGACQASRCTDGARDGDETDVDCGGATCPPCADGDGCQVAPDCVSRLCNQGVCQTSSMSCPAGYKEDATTGLCRCDPATCGTCCNTPEDHLCGISGDPALNNCGTRNQTCFRCDIQKAETCAHDPAPGGDYCAKSCDAGPCAGCCQKAAMLKMFCLHGTDDGACGTGGGPCAICPMGQRCVNHACVPAPDGGN